MELLTVINPLEQGWLNADTPLAPLTRSPLDPGSQPSYWLNQASDQPQPFQNVIGAAIAATETYLTTFAASANFAAAIQIAFGIDDQSPTALPNAIEDLRQQWLSQSWAALPTIEIRSATELHGALGAFSAETQTIYLSQTYLEQHVPDPQAIATVLLEELGHFIDTAIHQSDAPGDEGELFSALVRGVNLDVSTLALLKAEDDHAWITLDGQTLLVEQATVNGLRGEYYDTDELTNLKLTRTDSTVNFSWGTGSPAAAIAADTFSARWTGQVKPNTSGTYTFFVQADDGVRLWVNGTQLINDWEDYGVTRERRGTISLTAGQLYNIRLEYFELSGQATAKLLWSGPSVTKQIIPSSQLFSESLTDSTPPTASLSVGNVTTGGSSTYDFSVTYSDNTAVNVSTLDNTDIRVTGPNGFNQLATRVSVNNSTNGTPRTATYRITTPGGSWDSTDNGSYTVALQANQVSDTSGNSMAASTLGTFQVNVPMLDTIAPTASATVTNITTAGGSTYQFSVTYSDNTAVNVPTLNGSDILVTGPGNFSQFASLVSVNNSTNGTPRTATYQITAPGNSWDSADNGTYTLALQPNQVSDTSGNFMSASTLSTFQVNVAPLTTGENIVFPADAGVLNVKDFGAKGDGITDDTAAIQAALNAYPNGMRIIYLPNGTYLVSGTLTWPAGTPGTGNDYKNTTMQGQSQNGVIIKLANGASGFGNANAPQAVIFTGPAPAQRFGNSIRNLTVDTGTGNPGAIGIQFNASNQGSMRQVTIQSGDGQGVTGLDFDFADEIGPLLVKDVTIKGFQYGIVNGYTVNSQTFENITLQNQSVYGFFNYSQVVSIHNLTSTNSVSAIYNALPDTYNPNGLGHMTLINATLNGTGTASNRPAIVSGGTLLARGITTSGYQSAILSDGTTVVGPFISEFVSNPVTRLSSTATTTLNLPIEETPDVPWDNLADWANVVAFGAIPNDGLDDSAAIQAAIDSGKTTVYLPVGNYNLANTVFIRSNVRRLLGTEAYVEIPNTLNPGFKLVDGTAPVVVFERIHSGYNSTPTIENASSRTLVIRDALNVSGNMTGPGKVFIENVVSNPFSSWTFNGQNVWARQFNVENTGTHIINNGGNLWILGLKTERGGTLIDTRNGGRTEVLGGLAYTTTGTVDGTQNDPMFISNESFISISMAEVKYSNTVPNYTTYVREIRGGVTRNLSGSSLPNYWGSGEDIPLFVGY